MGSGRPHGSRPGSRPRHAGGTPARRRAGGTATRGQAGGWAGRLALRRKVWVMAGVAALATMALVAGLFIGLHLDTGPRAAPGAGVPPTGVPPAGVPAPAPSSSVTGTPPWPAGEAGLAADFAQLETKLQAVAGIVVSAVGNGQPPTTFGDWQTGPAWSTIKVPLIIAGLRAENPPEVTDAMKAAITESDNAAAESVWATLGDPVTAAHKVEDVLRQTGDPTIVQSQKVRPEFTAFGQTIWPLTEQVRFLSVAVCDKANDPVFSLMGQVEPDQRWGIGTIAGTRFKGGWGPSPTGKYLVRQMGVLDGPNGRIAVALAAEPNSGKFDDGTAALTEIANWLSAHLGALQAGQCPQGSP